LSDQLRGNGDAALNRAFLEILGNRLLFLTEADDHVVMRLGDYENREKNPDLKALAREVLRRIQDNTLRAHNVVDTQEQKSSVEKPLTATSPTQTPIAIGQPVEIWARKQIPFKGVKGIVLGLRKNPEKGYLEAAVEIMVPGKEKPKKIAVPLQFLRAVKPNPPASVPAASEREVMKKNRGSSRLKSGA
jgi:hypothetical protein